MPGLRHGMSVGCIRPHRTTDMPAARCEAEQMSGQLSNDEMRDLMRLLRRHAETSMDQWERWRLSTTFGQVFIDMRMTPQPESSAASYEDMTEWSADR